MPWVSFSRHEAETTPVPKTATKKQRKKVTVKSSANAKAGEVVAKIVADIARTLRH